MSVLSDKSIFRLMSVIFGEGGISPDQVQPCSVDLRLDQELKTLTGETINIKDEPYTLEPDEFILGSTIEEIYLLPDLLARVEGRSSIGRLGVGVHVTAGFVDPGFHGNITLEIKNVSDQPFTLNYEDKLCQVVFEKLEQECENPYDGKYQGDTGVVCSRWDEE